jgi:hypothetical protein
MDVAAPDIVSGSASTSAKMRVARERRIGPMYLANRYRGTATMEISCAFDATTSAPHESSSPLRFLIALQALLSRSPLIPERR